MFDLKDLIAAARDKEAVKEFLTTQAKKDISIWIDTKVIPTAKDVIVDFNKALVESAESEKGWAKIRDKFFIPAVLNIVLWAFTQMSNIIQKETSNES